MTIEQASEIINDWGVHLEHVNGKLMLLFLNGIPESLLPHSIHTIKQASHILCTYCKEQGREENATAIISSVAGLLLYVDDEVALIKAGENFQNESFREALLKRLKKSE